MLSFPLPALSERKLKSVWAVQCECSFLRQCSFLMPCWLCWAWSAMFSVIVGISWRCFFPVSWGSLGYGSSSGLCVLWSRSYPLCCQSLEFTGGKGLLVFQLLGPTIIYSSPLNALIWRSLSLGWSLWFGQLHNLSKEIKIVMLRWTHRLFMSMLNHLNTTMFL